MLDVASQVFGVRFPDDAVIGEERREAGEFLSPVDHSLPLPSPAELAGLPDPAATPGGLDAVARATVGCDTADPRELGRRLLAHPLTHALLRAKDAPLTAVEAQWNRRLLDDARRNLTHAVEAAESIASPLDHAMVHRMPAGTRWRRSAYDLAVGHPRRAVRLSEEDHSPEGRPSLARTPHRLGLTLRKQDDRAAAEETPDRALELCREVYDPVGEAAVLNTLGALHYDRGDHDRALHHCADALRVVERTRERNGLASADGTHRELRLPVHRLNRNLPPDGFIAAVALVLAEGTPGPPPEHVRIVEFALFDGRTRELFTGSRAEALAHYRAHGPDALAGGLDGREYRPGTACGSRPYLPVCPALRTAPGLLGVEAPGAGHGGRGRRVGLSGESALGVDSEDDVAFAELGPLFEEHEEHEDLVAERRVFSDAE